MITESIEYKRAYSKQNQKGTKSIGKLEILKIAFKLGQELSELTYFAITWLVHQQRPLEQHIETVGTPLKCHIGNMKLGGKYDTRVKMVLLWGF